MDRSAVCVLLPTLEEAATIGDVVSGFREAGYENVLVIDGGSTDGTREIAEQHGAQVEQQTGSGKGQAVREAMRYIKAPYVLMADGDGTYRPEDADQMVAPLIEGRANHVIGDRFADMEAGAMTRLNRVGNRLVNRAFRLIHGRQFRDILSGYRAFTRKSFERYDLSARGFGIETELAVECVKHGTPTTVVPVTYRARPAESETNLHPVKDGGRIFLTLFRLAKTNNPLFYFGSVGIASLLVGLGIAAFVAYEWFIRTPPVSHEALAVVAAAGIILGVQLVMFGVLSDVIVAVNREQTRRLEELAEQLGNQSANPNETPQYSDEERDDARASAEAGASRVDRQED